MTSSMLVEMELTEMVETEQQDLTPHMERTEEQCTPHVGGTKRGREGQSMSAQSATHIRRTTAAAWPACIHIMAQRARAQRLADCKYAKRLWGKKAATRRESLVLELNTVMADAAIDAYSHAVALMDRVLSKAPDLPDQRRESLLAFTCGIIALKMEDSQFGGWEDLLQWHSWSSSEVLACEAEVLSLLEWRITSVGPSNFIAYLGCEVDEIHILSAARSLKLTKFDSFEVAVGVLLHTGLGTEQVLEHAESLGVARARARAVQLALGAFPPAPPAHVVAGTA